LNYVDYILLFFLLLGFVLGFKDGLIRKVIGFVGFLLALYVSFSFAEKFGTILQPIFNGEKELAEIVGGIVLFFLSILLVAILKRILHPVDKVNRFVNQLLGGISGAIQMLYFLSAILILLSIFNFPKESDKSKSVLYETVYKILPVTIDWVLGSDSSAKEFLNGYLPSEDKIKP